MRVFGQAFKGFGDFALEEQHHGQNDGDEKQEDGTDSDGLVKHRRHGQGFLLLEQTGLDLGPGLHQRGNDGRLAASVFVAEGNVDRLLGVPAAGGSKGFVFKDNQRIGVGFASFNLIQFGRQEANFPQGDEGFIPCLGNRQFHLKIIFVTLIAGGGIAPNRGGQHIAAVDQVVDGLAGHQQFSRRLFLLGYQAVGVEQRPNADQGQDA